RISPTNPSHSFNRSHAPRLARAWDSRSLPTRGKLCCRPLRSTTGTSQPYCAARSSSVSISTSVTLTSLPAATSATVSRASAHRWQSTRVRKVSSTMAHSSSGATNPAEKSLERGRRTVVSALLLVATLVTCLAKLLAVLLLRHTLAALLDD